MKTILSIFQSDRIPRNYREKIHCSLRTQEYRFEFETGNGFIFQIVDSVMQSGGGGGGGAPPPPPPPPPPPHAGPASTVRPGARINFKALSLNILSKILQTNLNTLKNTVS